MKKILITSSNYFTVIKFRLGLIEYLLKEGYQVSVFASNDPMSIDAIEKLKSIGVRCYESFKVRNFLSPIKIFIYLKKYRQLLLDGDYTVCINFTIIPVFLGGIVCRFNKQKFISVITGLGSQFHGSNLHKFIYKFLFNVSAKFSNQIWFVSKSDASIAKKILQFNPSKVRIIYGSGVEIPYKKISTYSHKSISVIFMGRLREDKGIYDYIDLVKRNKDDRRFDFFLMGLLDEKKNKLTKMINEAQSYKNLKIVNFSLQNIRELEISDVLILCSRHEGMPKTLLEAMANKVIPISSNIPVANELNEMGAQIQIYQTGNIRDLQEKLNKVYLLSEDQKENLVSLNYNFVRSNFAQEKIASLQGVHIEELIKHELL